MIIFESLVVYVMPKIELKKRISLPPEVEDVYLWDILLVKRHGDYMTLKQTNSLRIEMLSSLRIFFPMLNKFLQSLSILTTEFRVLHCVGMLKKILHHRSNWTRGGALMLPRIRFIHSLQYAPSALKQKFKSKGLLMGGMDSSPMQAHTQNSRLRSAAHRRGQSTEARILSPESTISPQRLYLL